jgi:SAM-dependent methyltransferase
MKPDAVDLRDFYATRRGRLVGRILADQTARIWPDMSGLTVAGLGYPTPVLGRLAGGNGSQPLRVMALMPGFQGVIPWPASGPRRSLLVEEAEWPLPDESVDRLLVLHGLERSHAPAALLREAWRVLAPEGRLLLAVPNRTGWWAHAESTPFGHGAPYSAAQLRALLRDKLFVPESERRALFVPPLRWARGIGIAWLWEALASRLFPVFAGVILMEAGKQLYGGVLAQETEKLGGALAAAKRGIGIATPASRRVPR